jgi:hypothetical protein
LDGGGHAVPSGSFLLEYAGNYCMQRRVGVLLIPIRFVSRMM